MYPEDVWEIEYTNEFEQWWQLLSQPAQDAIEPAISVLSAEGPSLGRPLVGSIKGSRHANMKELRPGNRSLRILFAFDPRRTAILLLGGDTTHIWRTWYEHWIPIADQLYDDYLAELRREGELP